MPLMTMDRRLSLERRAAARMVAFVLAGCTLAHSTPTFAANETETGSASDIKMRGDRAMDRAAYGEALAAYREAYARDPSPSLRYNLGRAAELSGDYATAYANLEAFSEEASADLRSKVPRLDALLTNLRTKIALLTVRANVTGGAVFINGREMATTPMTTSVAVMPGSTHVVVRADGYASYEHDVTLEAGRAVILDASLNPSGQSVDGGTPITRQWWFWTGVGAVVIGGAVAIVALTSTKEAPRGDIAPSQVSAPLMRF